MTGHRLLAPHPDLPAAVDAALAAIEDRRPGPRGLVSGFAEGADELVAARALQRGWTLHALLPLAPEAFAEDMERPGDYRELLARAATVETVTPELPRPDCYRAAGLALLDRSDELVAVWNGSDARGTGGTGEIVAEARSRRLPLTWIEAADARDGDVRAPITHVEGLA